MDPNETLEELRQRTEDALSGGYAMGDMDVVATDLAILFEALDQWLSKGGFLPSDWSARR